jgi:hypothetical protein
MEQQEEEDRKRETERLRADVEQQLLALKEMFAQCRKTDAEDSAAADMCISSNDARSEGVVAESQQNVVKAHSDVDANCESINTVQRPAPAEDDVNAKEGCSNATEGHATATERYGTASMTAAAVENVTPRLTASTA